MVGELIVDYILTGVLGFFIGITVCFFHMTCQIKSSNNLKKPREVDVNVGDIVWYQGEKWEVDALDCCGGVCKLRLVNSGRNYQIHIKPEFVKKVICAN